IRRHSQAAGARVKEEGADNDLLDRLAADPAIGMTRDEINGALNLREFVGRAPEQVVEFLEEEVAPVIARHGGGGVASDVRV
ncbi:MAG TPA: adenylosuccinate lyase, partial [Candidatus Hydrogenedentes bacterium]|nr:adenylosuccinate lyase [Candidatus Hydrogenedentota bacterium]